MTGYRFFRQDLTMTGQPKKWEVWLAAVRYEDSYEIKERPVVIYNNNVAIIVGLKVTSTQPREYCKGECELKYWKEANLDHCSTVRVSKHFKVSSTALRSKIGKLHPTDILRIEMAMLELQV